jgi:DNA-binding beta-propeller fold protein YncE
MLFRIVGTSGTGDTQLLRPRSAYVDTNGFVYVSDTYNNRIQVYDSNSNHVSSFGRLGSDPGEYGNPSRITMDNIGNLRIVDSANDRLQSIDTSGQFISQFKTRPILMEPYFSFFDSADNLLVSDGHNHKIITFDYSTGTVLSEFGSLGSQTGEFRGPRGIVIDSTSYIFVADNYNNKLSKFDSNGIFVSSYGTAGTGNGQFLQPRGLVIDSTGRILVADTQNNRIQIFDADMNHLSSISTTLPYQISLDASDNIYVAQQTADRIQKLNPNGAPLVTFGTSGSGPGQFDLPRGITVDTSGNIYVVDQGNNRIQKFDSDFNYITSFGTPGKDPGQFLAPRTIITDQDGNLVIADAGNYRVQVLDNNGNFIKQFTYEP